MTMEATNTFQTSHIPQLRHCVRSADVDCLLTAAEQPFWDM